MEELSINVDEFTDFIKESAKRFIMIKAKNREREPEKPEFTPQEMDRLLFEELQIPQPDGKIIDYVYFMTDGEYVKVGKGLPMDRLKACQTGNARKLKLLFTIPIGEADKGGDYYWRKTPGAPAEDALHHLFRHYHVRGEWFDLLDRINIRQCREYFGTLYRTGTHEFEHYKAIRERRKINERDTLETTD